MSAAAVRAAAFPAEMTAADGRLVRVRVARGFWARAKGLIGRRALEPNEGLLIPRCGAIHTFFMRFAIDAAFYDRRGRLVKAVCGIRPWRLLVWGGWRAAAVLETTALRTAGAEN